MKRLWSNICLTQLFCFGIFSSAMMSIASKWRRRLLRYRLHPGLGHRRLTSWPALTKAPHKWNHPPHQLCYDGESSSLIGERWLHSQACIFSILHAETFKAGSLILVNVLVRAAFSVICCILILMAGSQVWCQFCLRSLIIWNTRFVTQTSR